MIRDLDFPIRLVVGETVREPDGLAMSSRNAYLSPEERERAAAISRERSSQPAPRRRSTASETLRIIEADVLRQLDARRGSAWTTSRWSTPDTMTRASEADRA